MRLKVRNIVIAIFAILLLVVVVSAATSRSTTSAAIQMKNYYQAPAIFGTGVSYGKQTIVASNGRAFVAYNYQTGKDTLLSPDNVTSDLENIDKPLVVSPDLRYIAFHVSLTQAPSSLYTQLQNDNFDTTKSYWWLYDTQTKAFKPFPSTVVAVRFMNGNVYALTNLYGQQTVETYTPATLAATHNFSAPSSSNLFVTSDGFWLQSGSNVLQTSDGTVSTTLFTNTNVLNVSSDGKTALLKNTKSNQYIFYDVATKKQTVVSSSNGVQMAWDAQNDLLFGKAKSTKSDQSYTFFNAANSTTSSVTTYAQATKLLAVLDGQTALASNGTNSYIVGKNVSTQAPVPSDYDKTITVSGSYVEVQYFPSQTAFIISIDKAAAATQQAAVYQQLQQSGYNPDLLEIRFSLFIPPTSFN